jgi:surface carbohydrate biosynthesis protein
MKVRLIIPIESQVREFDAKLLLACIAANHGFISVIGHPKKLKTRIYLAKDIKASRSNMFKIMRKLGYKIVAWDEEALVHLPPDTYFSRRLSPKAIQYISHLFAWGGENAKLWSRYEHLPSQTAVHVTGNPRGDLLRPEMHDYYERDVLSLRRTYGDFILVNTNFKHVNCFAPINNLFQPVSRNGEEPKFGRAAMGMSREYAEGLRDHKQAVFEDFQGLIPALAQSFQDYAIVVRPHPSENREVYQRIAAQCERVQVTNEGNVIPWLMASKALIHNGCTTGVEAFVLGVPAISYRATVNDRYDLGFYGLPNLLSHECFNFEHLKDTLDNVLSGAIGPADGDERKELMDRHMTAREGPLACERIVNVLAEMIQGQSELPEPSLSDRLEGRYKATRRNLKRRFKLFFPDYSDNPEFVRHRYPGISLDELRQRVSLFQHMLNNNNVLKLEEIYEQIFSIRAKPITGQHLHVK